MGNRCLQVLSSVPILLSGLTTLMAEEVKKPIVEATEPGFIQYHNRAALFTPLHQVYERIKPHAFYAGVEAFLVSARNKKRDSALLDAELRMGYNFFFKGRDHLTPIAGIGYLQDFFREHHHRHHWKGSRLKSRPGIVYGTIGFLYHHEFNTVFNMGFNMKLLVGGPVTRKHRDWGSPVFGTNVSVPIIFRFGRNRHWDWRIEPFNLYVHGSKTSQDYWGCLNTLGYRF